MIIEMKMRLIIFSFFYVSILELRISADRFSRMPLFHHFYSKTVANAHFNSVFSDMGWFNRKTINTVRFSIIKIRISVMFMYLRSKLTSEMYTKVENLHGKTVQNCL